MNFKLNILELIQKRENLKFLEKYFFPDQKERIKNKINFKFVTNKFFFRNTSIITFL